MTKEGDSPVFISKLCKTSRAEHEKFCLKMGRPLSKAKYYWLTDSEQVPWGKGEKHPDKGVKENLKPDAYKQSEEH